MTVSPTFVRNGSAGNTLTFVYNPVAGGIVNGTVTIDVPTGWSDPSTDSSAAGYVTVSGGSVSIDGRTIVAAIVDRGAGNALTIKYGVKSRRRPGCDCADDVRLGAVDGEEQGSVRRNGASRSRPRPR